MSPPSQQPVIFLSWGGPRARKVAELLNDWLPRIFPTCEPWYSDESIDAGKRWSGELERSIAAADAALLILTPQNLTRPWVLIEAGALVYRLAADSRVIPYCLDGLESETLPGPLSEIQACAADRDGTARAVASLNRVFTHPIPEKRLDQRFTELWPELAQGLAELPPDLPLPEEHDDFDLDGTWYGQVSNRTYESHLGPETPVIGTVSKQDETYRFVLRGYDEDYVQVTASTTEFCNVIVSNDVPSLFGLYTVRYLSPGAEKPDRRGAFSLTVVSHGGHASHLTGEYWAEGGVSGHMRLRRTVPEWAERIQE